MNGSRLLVLASKPAGLAPSQRYRFEQWAPHLKQNYGISLDLVPFESPGLSEILYDPGHVARKAAWTLYDFARRTRVVREARKYDAIVIHREAALIGPALFERLLRKKGRPIIYDFDDAIWSDDQATVNGAFSKLHFFSKTSAICRLASCVTVGNDYLAAYARERNRSVYVIPSSIELEDYPRLPEAPHDGRFVVCWTGSASTLIHFEHVREALEAVASRIPLSVKIICSRPPDRPIAGAEMRFVKWSAEDEAMDVGNCHVGIMPLPDNEATRGKGGMKALQYMATGRPVVVSPVGLNSRIVRAGSNGFLASSAEDWVEALLQLAGSAELRMKLGDNGRRMVEKDYSATSSADRFAAVVKQQLDGRLPLLRRAQLKSG